MKKIATIAFAFIMISTAANSQAAKSLYFELGGPGLASINFDTRFSKREDGLGGKIGVGGFSIDGEGAVFVPIAVNYLLGKDGKNYFEIGAGVTPVFISSSTEEDNFTSTFGHLNFGYRLQPAKGGFTFRAFISPVFGSWGFFPYWGGVSFGYKF
ncbi:MAG: hypothetical protein ABIR18_12040 [Chitinophagaceae bacterium]